MCSCDLTDISDVYTYHMHEPGLPRITTYQQISIVLDGSYQVIFWYVTLQIQNGISILVDKHNNSACMYVNYLTYSTHV